MDSLLEGCRAAIAKQQTRNSLSYTAARPRERVVSAQVARAGGAIVIRAQAQPLLLPIAYVRNQAISLTHRTVTVALLHKTFY